MTCLHCGATTSNGLALCELCQRKGHTMLEYLPIYFHNLARWRPGRTGSRKVPGSVVLYDGSLGRAGTGDRISDALDDVLRSLIEWGNRLVEHRPQPRPLTWPDAVLTNDIPSDLAEQLVDQPAIHVDTLCVGFTQHLTAIATRDWSADFITALHHHETRLCAFTEALVPGWYAGACRRCEVPTYVIPGLTWVTCRGCGSTTYARDHLEVVLDEARHWIARPMRLAEAIVALVDTEQSVPKLHKRISKWGERGRIQAVDRLGYARELDYAGEKYAPKRYQLGDVIDFLFTEGATRLDATLKVTAS